MHWRCSYTHFTGGHGATATFEGNFCSFILSKHFSGLYRSATKDLKLVKEHKLNDF